MSRTEEIEENIRGFCRIIMSQTHLMVLHKQLGDDDMVEQYDGHRWGKVEDLIHYLHEVTDIGGGDE